MTNMNQINHISYRLLPLVLCIVSFSSGYVPQTSTCNPQSDVLFAEDPTSSQSFLMCKPYGPPEYGYWERHYCPNEMSFEFATQQCKTVSMPPNVIRQENDILHIAILNGSCANGEQCIGGTVCDLAKRRCLCPYGTVANLETLSCVQPQLPADNTLPPQQPAVSNPQQYANYYGQVQNTRYPSATLSGTNSAQNMATSFNQFYRNLLQSIQQPRVITGQPYTTGSSYTSKPTGNSQSLGVPAGSSCAQGEHCEGGSVCVHPMNICLCPGDSVNRNGQCVSLSVTKTEEQARPQPEITKVGIGGRCNQYNIFCDFSADCVNGYCQCLAPKVEYAGKCVTPKEAGPGEPCNGGQVCSRGSVCDPKMPVCVCPQGTDLSNGWCVPQQRPTPDTSANTNSVVQPNNIPTPYVSGGGYIPPNPTTSNAQIQPASAGSQIIENKSTSEENSRTPVPLSPPVPISSSLLSRGQTGVGARCSLNTECMQGAYCNGNSQPPTCQCLSTHVNVNDRCEKLIYPGQIGCDNDLQCTTAYAGTRCINRQCVCPPGSKAMEQTCISDEVPAGGSCSGGEQCTGASICSGGWCICPEKSLVIQKGKCVKLEKSSTDSMGNKSPFFAAEPRHVYHNHQAEPPMTTSPAVETTTQKISAPGSHCGPLDICVGGSSCVEGICLCPAGTRPSPKTGNCEMYNQRTIETSIFSNTTTASTPPHRSGSAILNTSTSSPTANTTRNELKQMAINECEKLGIVCEPGFTCLEAKCLPKVCPANTTLVNNICTPFPILNDDTSIETVSSKGRRYARPSESCANDEICTGGSICGGIGGQKICNCPSYRPLVREHICISTDENPMIKPKLASPGHKCDIETRCAPPSVCHDSLCRCQNGWIAVGGKCIELPSISSPAPPEIKPPSLKSVPLASYKPQQVEDTEIIMRKPKSDDVVEIGTSISAQRAPVIQDTQNGNFHRYHHSPSSQVVTIGSQMRSQPRFVGPPLRRPTTPAPKTGATGALEMGEGVGTCPAGNYPLRDRATDQLIVCNALEPNCPPKSYCFATGIASGQYNCCVVP